ncbi:D-alanyl-D-alanine carboxypeptidase family protein [Anaerostipes sp. MSJ-23]|uniref:D-alanyl-D-alanine carboxypeptidase family protein n=1 Tax=Anaerostipes sp. MSJ-23 TaxID=2841520 RepID=UPI001C106968|nr:D-alanyl-D-alanine carboxypeptidase family protein [Anaerostipes sp. MSJ-23]MBU5458874.1 D-alanyl-D-alanine carboxypeptidase [Anaerostipes sp. MSJ-23]
MKRWIVLILVFSVFLTGTVPVWADQVETIATIGETDQKLTAKSAVVMEAESKSLIYEKSKDKELPPASVTKVMSLLLIFEELEKGHLKLNDPVTVSQHAASMGGSQVFLEPSEVQDVETLIKCVVISSANDAVVALAEHAAGSEEAFVKRMNEKAKQLGMNHTTFKNACGLDEEGHVTTAYDIALMSRELIIKYPQVLKYTKIWMDTFTHKTKKGTKEFGLSNTNKMIRQYHGCTGLKTGSTGKAKFCLSATALRNGVHMIAVVMASDTAKDRIKDASALLDYGFANCQVVEDITTRKQIGKIEVAKGKEDQVQYPQQIKTKIIKIKQKDGNLRKEIRKKILTAPVKKGEEVGKILYKRDGKIIKKVPFYAEESVEKMDYPSSLWKLITQYF